MNLVQLAEVGAGETQHGPWEEGIDGEFGMDVDTPIHLKWLTKNLLYSPGSSAQCYVAAWMGGKFGGEWKQVSVRPSHSAVYPTLSQRNTVNQLQSNTKQKSCHKKRTGFDAIMST